MNPALPASCVVSRKLPGAVLKSMGLGLTVRYSASQCGGVVGTFKSAYELTFCPRRQTSLYLRSMNGVRMGLK